MMNLENYQYFLVVDLEATCCDRQSIPRQQMEIIEIGAVMVEAKSFNIISEFQTFIKPVRHTILTDFCQQLTSISQVQVDNAPFYREAIAIFKKWIDRIPSIIRGSREK